MKLLIFWLGRLVPAAILIGVGAWEITAGHAFLPLFIGAIVLGCLSLALSLWIARVHRRYRHFVASRHEREVG
jgi:hypothetical protein